LARKGETAAREGLPERGPLLRDHNKSLGGGEICSVYCRDRAVREKDQHCPKRRKKGLESTLLLRKEHRASKGRKKGSPLPGRKDRA